MFQHGAFTVMFIPSFM